MNWSLHYHLKSICFICPNSDKKINLDLVTVKISRILPVTCITQYASPGGASQRHVLGNTRHREEPPSDAYWVIHVTGRNLRILTVNTNNWVWGFNLHNNNVNAMHLAWTYWGIPSLSFEIGANTTFPHRPAASRDQDGIGFQSLRTQTVFPNMSLPDAWYTSSPTMPRNIEYGPSEKVIVKLVSIE